MDIAWETFDRIWFARFEDDRTGLRVRLVVEGLPDSSEWDWAVWLPDEPKVVRRGIAPSAREAAVASGEAAEQCLEAARTPKARCREQP